MEINNVEHLKKFKDIKEIKEILEEINELEKYQRNKEYKKAKKFLDDLSDKYFYDKMEYNALHPNIATTIEENLSNAIKFLFYKANKIIVKNTLGKLKENEK